VWFWKGWVRDEFTPEEWAEWEAHCAKQRAAADESALAEIAGVAAFFLGQGRPDPLGRWSKIDKRIAEIGCCNKAQ